MNLIPPVLPKWFLALSLLVSVFSFAGIAYEQTGSLPYATAQAYGNRPIQRTLPAYARLTYKLRFAQFLASFRPLNKTSANALAGIKTHANLLHSQHNFRNYLHPSRYRASVTLARSSNDWIVTG